MKTYTYLLTIGAALGLAASANGATSVWMSPTVNDGSFELSFGTNVLTDALGSTGTAVRNSEQNALDRSDSNWQYSVTDTAGNDVAISAGPLGFVEFGSNLGTVGGTNLELYSDGTGNPSATRGTSAFVDPIDRKVYYSNINTIPIPVGVSAGDTLAWAFDLNGIFATSLAEATLSIDFGSGGITALEAGTSTTDGLGNPMETIMGTHVLTAGDLADGAFKVSFTIHNQGTGNGVDGRLFLDNINITSIPEPTAALLSVVGLLGLLRRRRN